MSIPQRNKTLLTPTEKDRLKNPPMDTDIRKRNNLIIKRKIQYWLDAANDILYALDNIKGSQANDIFSDGDVFTLFSLTKKLLNKMGFSPVVGAPQHPLIVFNDVIKTKDRRSIAKYDIGAKVGMTATFTRRATASDFERNWQVQEFVKSLKDFYPSNQEMEERSPAYVLYCEKRKYSRGKEIATRNGIPFPYDAEMEAETQENAGSDKEFYGLGEKEYNLGIAQYVSTAERSRQVKSMNKETAAIRKIEARLSPGRIINIKRIARDVECEPGLVKDTIERRKRQKELKKAISKLEQDAAAIERIKVLWGEGWRNKREIAEEINHPRNAVIHVIEKMIERGEIAKEELVRVSQ
jgi:hypothetical protein